MFKIAIILLFSLMLLNANKINNFSEAKRALVEFYSKNQEYQSDFYCNAPFKRVKNHFEIIPSSLYSPRNNGNRARIIEWEHIMPSYNFGKHLSCWKNGGRRACQKDSLFKKMEADLQNLVPAIGEINGDRSNYRYAESPKNMQYTQYGNCKVFTDFKGKRFYPANYSKGWIARSYLYMSRKYKIKLSSQERKLMEAWDKQYPMSKGERVFREFAKSKGFL
ncbi:MAG: endonuclease [Helicobacter sp.]|nr:endonuclease [Helicobacter sp.]